MCRSAYAGVNGQSVDQNFVGKLLSVQIINDHFLRTVAAYDRDDFITSGGKTWRLLIFPTYPYCAAGE